MQTPCGKCSTCPCSGKKDKPPQQQQQQQPPPPQQQQQARPKVECLCASRRQQTPAPLQTPVADTYTCSRSRPEPGRPIPMEERCTCRLKPTPAVCECDPPVQPQQSYREMLPPTHAQITCGQPLPNQNERPQYVARGPGQCGHCQAQHRKKKCVIQ